MNSQNDDSKADPAPPIKRAPVLWLALIAIVLVCVSIIIFNVWQLEHAKDHELAQAEIATSNLSKSLAQQAEDTFDEADIILVDLVERLQND
ncbi:MAG: hypothetical protein JWQ69_2804, partial [Pseudomonas sp.]|nr:hypothetical protein [Pseudomonas sp.]